MFWNYFLLNLYFFLKKVTFARWIVEQLNGKIKNKFKLFHSRVSARYLPKAHKFWRITCALINAFGNVVLQDETKHMDIAERIIHQIPLRNELQV